MVTGLWQTFLISTAAYLVNIAVRVEGPMRMLVLDALRDASADSPLVRGNFVERLETLGNLAQKFPRPSSMI